MERCTFFSGIWNKRTQTPPVAQTETNVYFFILYFLGRFSILIFENSGSIAKFSHRAEMQS